MRSMGVGGVLVPLVSIIASATFLPAFLAVMGRGVNRFRVIPRRVLERRAAQDVTGGWHRFAMAIMRRPWLWGGLAAAVLIALALAATDLHLTGGDNRGIPITTEAARGLKIMEGTLGPGSLAPQQVVIDTHRPNGVYDPAVVAAQRRLVAQLRRDPEIQPDTVLAPALVPRAGGAAGEPRRRRGPRGADPRRRAQRRRRGSGRRSSCTASATATSRRPRFPASADVLLTGAPAFGVDFIDKSYSAFPWLVLAVLVHLLPAAAARLPLGLPAAQGGDHEPAVGERDATGC